MVLVMKATTPSTDSKRVLSYGFAIIIMVSSLFGCVLSQSGEIEEIRALPILEFGNNSRSLGNDRSDVASEEIFIPNGFPFGRTVHTSAFIGDNGVISFGSPFLLYNPVPFPGSVSIDVVAPYWSDNDIRREGSVVYEVFQSGHSSHGDMLLSTISDFVGEILGNSTFQGSYMILAEWSNVHSFPHGSDDLSLSPAQEEFIALSNTYQAIVITNHEESYAIFTYNCDQLQWAGMGSFPTIGFYSASDGIFENHPLTGQMNAIQIACGPNPTVNNVIYPLGFIDQQQRRMCLEWYLADLNNYDASLIAVFDQFAPPCPCTYFQALFDRRFFIFTFNPSGPSICFTTRFLTFGVALRECCYSFDGLTFGALVTDTENGGSLLLSPVPNESLQQNNRIPQSLCCSAEVGLCDLYYERRPPNFCFRYFPPRFVWGWGDPHITTLDGFTYTFNGIGEYVLVRSMDDDIEFQGRTAEVENSGATAFSAFAIRHNGTTVQISSSNGNFTVLVNGNDESDSLVAAGVSIQNSLYVLERLDSNSLLLSFPSGLTLTTNNTDNIFNFILNLPPSLNGSTEGLLGTLNGNISDDLIFRNGTLLPITSSDAEKHVFGQSWQITQSESIFQYMAGQNVTTFSQPDHVPTFLDEIIVNLEGNSSLTAVCGNNTECLFDFDQTGNEAVGMATMAFMEEVTESVVMSESFPPTISAPEIFLATVGVASTYSFIVTGSVNVSVVINGQSTLQPNTNFTDDGDTFTLTWSPADISEEFNLTIIATAEQSAVSTFVPRVQLCGCLNNGNCTDDGVLNLATPFVVLNCECPAAYDGNICENDADGCDAISCLAGQSCTDNPAPMASAVCACPDGYNTTVDSKCVDIDECNTTQHNCTVLQTCLNTPGSFICSCLPGYMDSLISPLLCEDINECDEGSDGCHQICTNTNGSFECSCLPEFELLPDQRGCDVSANSTCPVNNMCDQVCHRDATDNVLEICSCFPGYQLDSDNTSCSDINECDTNNGGCSQNCNNTIGGFSCSCNASFTLNDDDRTCNDINECEDTMMFPCPNTFLCSNTIGGYECICPPGTMSDGMICDVIVTPSSTISPSTPTLVVTTSTVIVADVTPSVTDTSSVTATPDTIPSVTGTPVIPDVTAEAPDSQTNDNDLSGGEIAAIVIGSVFGAVIVLVVITAIAYWLYRRRYSKSVDVTTGHGWRSRGTSSLQRRHVPSVIPVQVE